MLTTKQINEIKEHLERAQNPVFFFDNDPDGLCSFLLLRRYIERGKGVAIKSFPDLTEGYFRKIDELKADYVFILDKPVVSREFLEKVEQRNIPTVWIDHHDVQIEAPDFVSYYNPVLNEDGKNEPVTYLCYKITQRREDMWIAVVGCIYDNFIPDFYSEFEKDYFDLSVIGYKNAFDIFYKSEIGKVVKIFSFGLKDRTTNVVNMLRFLLQVKSPREVLEEGKKNYYMHKRFKQIESRYQKFLSKAMSLSIHAGKILFFQYGGDMSISSDLANALRYKFPKKIIVVCYISGAKVNVSVRGKNVRDLIAKVVEGFEGATSGGHEDAVGAKISVGDLEMFREKLKELVQ